MKSRVTGIRMNLKTLDRDSILSKVKALVQEERRVQTQVLRYLREIESRLLHLEMGYACLHAFCVVELSYSDGSAARRICARRVVCITSLESKRNGVWALMRPRKLSVSCSLAG